MRPFVASDYPEVAGWFRSHGETPPEPDALPVTGMIEPGVAAAFLIRTDTSVAYLDSMVSNPAASLRLRHRTLVELSDALSLEAERLGFRAVVATSKYRGIVRTAKANGFKEVGSLVMMVRAI
jgi:hypothetical protein